MKKLLVIILTSGFLICLAYGYSRNIEYLDGAVSKCSPITIKLLTDTVHTTGASFEITNCEDFEINFGYAFYLYGNVDGEWKCVGDQNMISFPALITDTVQPKQTIRWDIDWGDLYGELDPGKYKIVRPFSGKKRVSAYTESTKTIDGEVVCEFIIV